MTDYLFHFDGSCWPNPGGKCGFGWWGARIHGGDTVKFAQGRGEILEEPRTNNVAEFYGLIGVLQFAVCLTDAKSITIRGDSQLIVRCATGRSGSKKPHLAALIFQVRAMLNQFACPVRIEWVGRDENAEADLLAEVADASPSCA